MVGGGGGDDNYNIYNTLYIIQLCVSTAGSRVKQRYNV